MQTAERVNSKIFKEVFEHRDEILLTEFSDENFFIKGNTINLSRFLPSNIDEQFISYAMNGNQDISNIYSKLKNKIFEKYCYYLKRAGANGIETDFDFENFFYIHVKYIIRFFEDYKIKFIFAAPPSAGFDNLITEIAVEKNLNLVCLHQVHNGRFFWTTSWSDIGFYKTSKNIFPLMNIKLQEKLVDPYYMIRTIKNNFSLSYKIEKKIIPFINLLNSLRLYYYTFRIHLSLISFESKRNVFNIKGTLLDLYKFRHRTSALIDQYLKGNLDKKINYLSNLEKDSSSDNLKVLFYLKVQPEATEGFTEDEFITNPLVMIDELLRTLPDNAVIYLKEHPDNLKSFIGLRRYFWEIVSLNKRVKILDIELRTKSIIDDADIVATFDGTVGWEALLRGKPVITFGNPWYQCMPGVFSIDDLRNEDVNIILKNKWSREILENKFRNLTSFMGEGYIIDIRNGAINAADEFVNGVPLDDSEKKKRLLNNDLIVAKSFLKIYESLVQ
jgi:hypothetical protein